MKMIIWNKFGKVEFTQMPNGLCAEIDAHNTVRFTFRGKPEVVFTAKCMSREEAKAVAEKHIPAFAPEFFTEHSFVEEEPAKTVVEPPVEEKEVEVEELPAEEHKEELSPVQDDAKSLRIFYAPEEDGKYSVEIYSEYGDDYVVRYTSNGKDVTFRNKVYKDPLIVSAGSEVKAAVFDDDNTVVEECSLIVEG